LGGSGEEDQQVAPRSPWTEEAVSWVSTYEMVHGKRVGDDGVNEETNSPSKEPLAFSTFANACVVPKKIDSPTARDNRQLEVYLSDSSKTRRDVLVHIFKPLLGDIFAYNVVNSIFQALGILDDSEYLLKVGFRMFCREDSHPSIASDDSPTFCPFVNSALASGT
jgi:hypothetical protein